MTDTRIGWPVPCIQRLRLEPPPTSYSGVVSYWPSRIRLALAVVPPMSKERRLPRPVWRATSAAATTPAAGPDSTAIAGMATASPASRMPPLERHDVERRQALAARRLLQARQVGGEDRADVGAHRRRAGALELLDLRQHLAGEIDRHARQRGAQARAEPALVLGVEEAEQQRDGDAPRRARPSVPRSAPSISRLGQRRDDGAVGADALGDLEAAAARDERGRAHPGTGRRGRRGRSAAAPARRGSRAW